MCGCGCTRYWYRTHQGRAALPALRALPAFLAFPALEADPIVKGPEKGALVIVGGGKVGAEILGRMFELAGGKDAPLVVIPTASGADDYPPDWPGLKMFRDFGATNISLVQSSTSSTSCVAW